MATMEHVCTGCSWFAMDNCAGPYLCPKCGARVQHFWDEANDHDYRDDDREDLKRELQREDW